MGRRRACRCCVWECVPCAVMCVWRFAPPCWRAALVRQLSSSHSLSRGSTHTIQPRVSAAALVLRRACRACTACACACIARPFVPCSQGGLGAGACCWWSAPPLAQGCGGCGRVWAPILASSGAHWWGVAGAPYRYAEGAAPHGVALWACHCARAPAQRAAAPCFVRYPPTTCVCTCSFVASSQISDCPWDCANRGAAQQAASEAAALAPAAPPPLPFLLSPWCVMVPFALWRRPLTSFITRRSIERGVASESSI